MGKAGAMGATAQKHLIAQNNTCAKKSAAITTVRPAECASVKKTARNMNKQCAVKSTNPRMCAMAAKEDRYAVLINITIVRGTLT